MKSKHITIHSAYLDPGFEIRRRNKICDNIVKGIKLFKRISGKEIHAIAFTGVSGAIVAPIVSYLLDIPLIAVRKDDSKTHSYYKVEGALGEYDKDYNYIVVDDIIATGETVKVINEKITKTALESKTRFHLTAVFLYAYSEIGKIGHLSSEENRPTLSAAVPVYGMGASETLDKMKKMLKPKKKKLQSKSKGK